MCWFHSLSVAHMFAIDGCCHKLFFHGAAFTFYLVVDLEMELFLPLNYVYYIYIYIYRTDVQAREKVVVRCPGDRATRRVQQSRTRRPLQDELPRGKGVPTTRRCILFLLRLHRYIPDTLYNITYIQYVWLLSTVPTIGIFIFS